MARPNIAHYERSKKKHKPLDLAALAKATGVPKTPAFKQLLKDADAVLGRYDAERAVARDETRHLLAGVRDLRDRLYAAHGAFRRLADNHFEAVFDGLVLDALGEDGLRPFAHLDARLSAAIEACDAVLGLHDSRPLTVRPDPSTWAGTVFEVLDPRLARRRLAEGLATLFQRYTSKEHPALRPPLYRAHLYEFVKAIFKHRGVSWPPKEDRTSIERLIPARLRRPLPR